MHRKLVLASNNQGKIGELNSLLSSFELEVVPQSAYTDIEAEETGLTFIENALIKARHASACSGLPAIADDSGLEVDYLKGAPGIYSARFSADPAGGIAANDQRNNDKLLALLKDVPDPQRKARFQCCVVFMRHSQDPTPLVCHGTWEGLIARSPSGDGGFGYDPLFYIPELGCTSAQLDKETKNQLSHRAKAISALLQALPNHPF